MPHPALTANRAAVITGAAGGIGLATAERLAALDMNVCIADVEEDALATAAETLAGAAPRGADAVLAIPTDVSRFESVEALRDAALGRFGEVAFLMNNAGVGGGGAPWQNLEGWQRVIGVNLWGVIHGLQVVHAGDDRSGHAVRDRQHRLEAGNHQPARRRRVQRVESGDQERDREPRARSCAASKDCQVTAHLLVPGFTYTGMIRRFLPEKPDGAWLPEQVADYLLDALERGDFYVLCPDNDVTVEMDQRRIEWAAGDLVENRPALSRWHPDHAAAFEAFMERPRDRS